MAVVPKHGQNHNKYDPSQDLTADQIHRFGQVANKVQEQKEQQDDRPSAMAAARRAALRPVIPPKAEKPNTARYAIWLMVILGICLWLMYMSG